MRNICILASLFSLLLLPSCSETKEKLKGKREPFIVVGDALKPDPALKDLKVILPEVQNISEWPCVGGTPHHVVMPAKLSENLQKVWEESIGDGADTYHRLITHPVVAQDIIYTMDINSVIKARSCKDGALLWEQNVTPEGVECTSMGGGFAVVDDNLFITTSFGEVWCVDAKDGKKIWVQNLNTPVRAAPTVYENRIFVVTVNNEIYALDVQTGEEIWNYAGIIEPNSLLGGSSPALTNGAAAIALTSGEVYVLRPETGHVMWTETLTPALRVDTVSSIAHIRARPIIDGGVVYLASHGGRLAAYELLSGKKIWNKDIGALRTPALAGDFLFVITTNDDLVCVLKKTGQVKWATALPRKRESEEVVTWAGPIVVNNQLVLTGTNSQMLFVNASDGEVAKTVELSDPCQLSPITANGTLFTLTDSGMLQAWR
jgi:outer membrane protein assembly factor BamB